MGVDVGVAFSGGETGRVVALVAAGSGVAAAGAVGAGESLGPLHPTNEAATAAMASPVLMRRHFAALTQNRNLRRVLAPRTTSAPSLELRRRSVRRWPPLPG